MLFPPLRLTFEVALRDVRASGARFRVDAAARLGDPPDDQRPEALRGLRTLHLRVERAQDNAQELVRRLGEHPALSEVRYPGFGGIVSIVLAQGEMAADLLCRKTRLWVHATSLGGVESTLERRRRWKAEAATIPDGLVRLSVGIEDVEDLWDALRTALDGCVG